VQTGDGLWHGNPAERRQVCDTSTTPQICVNARHTKLLPQVTEALSGITDRLEDVRNLPVRFEDRPGAPRHDEVELTPIGWSVVRGRLTDPRQYAWEAVGALEHREYCKAVDRRPSRAHDAVEHYLAPHPAEKYFDSLRAGAGEADRAALKARLRARARLASMGEEERRAWLSAYFAAAGRCDPKGVSAL
jgi:hypothetical protein